MFTLAHVSDWHATSLEGVRPRELMNKRVLGWLSWMSGRRHVHRLEVLRALFRDLKGQGVDTACGIALLQHVDGAPDDRRDGDGDPVRPD